MQYTQDEWDKLVSDFPPGTSVSGMVVACQRFGVFVRLDELPGVPALLEIIHFKINEDSPHHVIQFPSDYPPIGATVNARILAWSAHPKDVRLTQLSDLRWTRNR